MKRKLLTVLRILVIFIISLFLVRFNKAIEDGELKIIEDEFVITYLGILAGFSLSIIAYMYSSLERIRDILKANDNWETLNFRIANIFAEVKDDIMFSFYSLVFCMFSIFIRDMSFMPSWSILGFNEAIFFNSIKMTSMAITTLALFDIAISTFMIIDATNVISDKHKEP